MFEPKIWKKPKKNALEHCYGIRIVRLVRIKSAFHVKLFLKADSLRIIPNKKLSIYYSIRRSTLFLSKAWKIKKSNYFDFGPCSSRLECLLFRGALTTKLALNRQIVLKISTFISRHDVVTKLGIVFYDEFHQRPISFLFLFQLWRVCNGIRGFLQLRRASWIVFEQPPTIPKS